MSSEPISTLHVDYRTSHLSFVAAPRGVYVRIAKPIFDRTVAATALVVLSPLLAVVALGVRWRIGRPVLFRQARCGLGGVAFDVVKFRTMRADRRMAHRAVFEDRRVTHKTARDPRHTDLGRTLRKWSLDELPQLWNVVKGEMSLVGPRPELVGIVARYEPWQHQRHLVRPGLTGLWQVSRRGDGLMHLCTDVDLEYVATIGWRADLQILLRTLPAAMSRSGS